MNFKKSIFLVFIVFSIVMCIWFRSSDSNSNNTDDNDPPPSNTKISKGNLTQTEDDVLELEILNHNEDEFKKATYILENKETFDRIQNQIKLLKQESLQNSFDQLNQVEMFFWPGARTDYLPVSSKIPMENIHEYFDIDSIWSNRRAIKIFQSLNELPTHESTKILNAELDKAFEAYKEMFEKRYTSRPESFSPDVPDNYAIFSQISNNPDGTPTLNGHRHAVLSLVYIAGELNLKETNPKILQITQYALEQRKTYYNHEEVKPSLAANILIKKSLYNRRILSNSLVKTHFSSEQVQDIYTDNSITTEDMMLTNYDAPVTPHDLPARYGFPVEYPNTQQKITIISPISDNIFDDIYNNVVKN